MEKLMTSGDGPIGQIWWGLAKN